MVLHQTRPLGRVMLNRERSCKDLLSAKQSPRQFDTADLELA